MRMIKIAAMALFLSACAPDVVTKPIDVSIPVSVPCKAPAVTMPVVYTKGIQPTDSMLKQAQALAATNEQRKGYESRLVAGLRACQ